MRPKGHGDVVRVLIDAGVDVNEADDEGRTALGVAAANGHEVIAVVLIEAGSDVNKAVDHGQTPLHCDAANDHDARC